jgi:hypothetical protein
MPLVRHILAMEPAIDAEGHRFQSGKIYFRQTDSARLNVTHPARSHAPLSHPP